MSQMGGLSRFLKVVLGGRIFALTTLLPVLAAAIYFGLVASDVYITESQFVVRAPDKSVATPLGTILKGAGISRGDDDAFVVADFIVSRDAMLTLEDRLKIKAHYSSPGIDMFSRFGGVDHASTMEEFFKYYKDRVTVDVDPASQIATLTVRAFSAELAYQANLDLVEMAEGLVNRLNERERQDILNNARQLVAETTRSVEASGAALTRFRNAKGVIDPERQSSLPLQAVQRLQEEEVETKSKILQLESLAKDNPMLPVLRDRERFLGEQIQGELAKVTGEHGSLAGKASEYQHLVFEKELAERLLASAVMSLQDAHAEAQRKQLYIERLDGPNKPDRAMEPRRLRAVLATLAIGLLLWAIASMLVSGMREHMD